MRLLHVAALAAGLTVAAPRVARAQAHAHHHAAGDSTGASLFLHARPEAYLLADQLRRGGLLVFMRHGKTDVDGVDQLPANYADCASQRNLSAAGRATTAEVAESWRFLGITIDDALASPYCRVIETARALVPTARRADSLAVVPPGDGAGDLLRAMLTARRPAAGSNVLLVGHVISALQAFDVKLQEGESLVLEPATATTPLRVLGRVTATEWGDVHRDTKQHGVAIVTRAAKAQATAAAHAMPHAR